LLYDESTMRQIWLLRRMISLISNDGSANATERVLERLAKYSTNQEFLANLNKET
jgi:transcription termination factor Rho